MILCLPEIVMSQFPCQLDVELYKKAHTLASLINSLSCVCLFQIDQSIGYIKLLITIMLIAMYMCVCLCACTCTIVFHISHSFLSSTVGFEMWHLELIIGLVILVSSCRYLLLKTWPDFAESSEAANRQVVAVLLSFIPMS